MNQLNRSSATFINRDNKHSDRQYTVYNETKDKETKVPLTSRNGNRDSSIDIAIQNSKVTYEREQMNRKQYQRTLEVSRYDRPLEKKYETPALQVTSNVNSMVRYKPNVVCESSPISIYKNSPFDSALSEMKSKRHIYKVNEGHLQVNYKNIVLSEIYIKVLSSVLYTDLKVISSGVTQSIRLSLPIYISITLESFANSNNITIAKIMDNQYIGDMQTLKQYVNDFTKYLTCIQQGDSQCLYMRNFKIDLASSNTIKPDDMYS